MHFPGAAGLFSLLGLSTLRRRASAPQPGPKMSNAFSLQAHVPDLQKSTEVFGTPVNDSWAFVGISQTPPTWAEGQLNRGRGNVFIQNPVVLNGGQPETTLILQDPTTFDIRALAIYPDPNRAGIPDGEQRYTVTTNDTDPTVGFPGYSINLNSDGVATLVMDNLAAPAGGQFVVCTQPTFTYRETPSFAVRYMFPGKVLPDGCVGFIMVSACESTDDLPFPGPTLNYSKAMSVPCYENAWTLTWP